MKSVKVRITLWYALLLLGICAVSVFSLHALHVRSAEKYCRETLESAAAVIMDEMEIEHGLIEIDSDIDDVPNVYAALFDPEGNLIYGRERVSAQFEEDALRLVKGSGHQWYIRDTLLTVPDHEPVWLRIHMSADLTVNLLDHGVWLLPVLAVIALLGGYLITARAFRPVQRMTALAASIAGSGDLSQRVALSGSGDELDALAGTFNRMLVRLQEAFVREQRFTADAAHELRTPLNAMRMQGEYALSRETAQEKDEGIAAMLSKNEEMQTLVGQLLMIARMDAGQNMKKEPVALAEMIDEVAKDLEPVAKEKEISIRTELSSCMVMGDPAMLARTMINLIDNAVRYGKRGGHVCIRLEQVDTDAVIRVEDDGVGMTQEEAGHVFERFWRADASRSTAGSGVGLAIVDSAVRAHGGSVSAESRKGEGSCFTIRLSALKE